MIDQSVTFMQAIAGDEESSTPIFDKIMTRLPVLTTTDQAPFPYTTYAIDITSDKNEKTADNAIKTGSYVFVVNQKADADVENIKADDLYRYGVIARVMHMMRTPDDVRHAFIETFERVLVLRYYRSADGFKANVLPTPINMAKDEMIDISVIQQLTERFEYLMRLRNFPHADNVMEAIKNTNNLITNLSIVANQMPISGHLKQEALQKPTLREIAEALLKHMEISIRLSELKIEIEDRTRADLSDQQREGFLQAQIRQIQQEIGQGTDNDIAEFESRAAEKLWSEDTAAHFKKELSKLTRYPVTSPDYSIQYGYLDRMLTLPWRNYNDDNFSLDTVEKTLNRDHFGLEKVKERILEQMAVFKLRNDLHAPILCLVGPPGVGKTSLGKSIADAMGREYKRISFGGMHDEAEIRGHRRTYIGAMPGRIITALEKCKTGNPVIVLDEIDKIGADFKGDPSSALLEVLDPEQNSTFHDNYLDTDYDLSHILFIATANSLSTISAPLLDRMEVISLSGYITAEKVEIAKNHLIPKLLKDHGYDDNEIDFQRQAIIYLIDYYTRESGVRQLEKVIAKVLRKIARLKVSGKPYPTSINKKSVSALLGKEEYSPDMYENNDYTGVVTGLAWTSVGGEILFIESSVTKGTGKVNMTGNLGDVMKESATISVQYLKANANLIGMSSDDIAAKDIHIHVPEGAIPKDGPSAGITMVTSVASALSGRKVRSHLAMTGEITLRGKVLPVGGIKEKIIAAKRAGITEIILSKDNMKDIRDINERYISGLTFTYVSKIEEVLDKALL